MTGLSWFGFWIFMAVVFYVAHVQYMAGHDTLPFTHKTDTEKKLRDRALSSAIILTPAEIQSGQTRVDWAEGLIKQLPEDHDGRNSWLLNYGKTDKDNQ